eukprot:m.31221 g.31221  ORF g.31221 m.31221 type:complete len:61 (-) comp9390_c1_seq1:477-659(-)
MCFDEGCTTSATLTVPYLMTCPIVSCESADARHGPDTIRYQALWRLSILCAATLIKAHRS